MNSRLLNNDIIKAEAKRLGFFACGIAKAERVDEAEERCLNRWIAEGNYANMEYMANHTDIRLDPRLLLNGAKIIVSVAMNYAPKTPMPDGQPKMAAYSYGLDYHDIVRKKLYALAQNLGLNYDKSIKEPEKQEFRVCVDTAPILERYWAQKAGIGWQGRSHQLIIPHAGTMFFLGELIIAAEVDHYDKPMENHCGNCSKCIDACPTKALNPDGTFCSSRCLSYITIESKEAEISDDIAHTMGDTFYGCDRCQQACPWNRFATATDIPELQPKPELLDMTWEKWQSLTEDDYRRLFKGCAAKRAKYDGIMRNIRAITKANDKNNA